MPIWNSLSNHFVSADTINTFTHRQFLANQEVEHLIEKISLVD